MDTIVLDGPPDDLLEKLATENPHWSVEDWADWWGKWFDRQAKRKGLCLSS